MPTKRTIAELFAFFATGQPSRSITPDRVQDLIETLREGFGRISLTSQLTTTIPAVNQWVAAAGVTTAAAACQCFDMPQNGRLRFIGLKPSRVIIEASVNITDGNNKVFEVALAKNGNVMPETVRVIRLGAGGDIGGSAIMGDFDAVQNDFVEVYIRNVTDNTDAIFTKLYLRARSYVL
jgi:hypothetical protein